MPLAEPKRLPDWSVGKAGIKSRATAFAKSRCDDGSRCVRVQICQCKGDERAGQGASNELRPEIATVAPNAIITDCVPHWVVPSRQRVQGNENNHLHRYSEDLDDAKGANHVRRRGSS
jgi:hypothetical protein